MKLSVKRIMYLRRAFRARQGTEKNSNARLKPIKFAALSKMVRRYAR